MKKILSILFIILVAIFILIFITYKEKNINKIINNTIEEEFYIDYYSIMGTHLSVNACIDKIIDDELNLVLKNNDKEIILNTIKEINDNKTCLKFSENNNDGLNLEELEIGTYIFLVKQNNDYYTLKNITEYSNLEYYTITKNKSNNKIDIEFDKFKDKDYVKFSITKSKLPEDVYDITIDPGHGGKDVGALYTLNGTTYYESDLTLEISLLLKEQLEKLGLKVKMTRDNDIWLDPYGEGGRALIANDVNSKYSLSIHFNSSEGKMSYGGVEIYTPNNVDYTLARMFASNLAQIVDYSKNPSFNVEKGIYYKYFTQIDVEKSKIEMEENNMIPFDIKAGIPYMYMIREVGGINTGAYIDGRNEEYGLNKYYNSNKTAEPYLLELAYIKYEPDLFKLINEPESFASAISNTLKEFLKIS